MPSVAVVAPPAVETTTYKVIIGRGANSEVLLADDGSNLTLPSILIPRWTRVAPEMTKAIFQTLGLRTILLFHSDPPGINKEPSDRYVVLESRDSSWQPPAGLRWSLRDEIRTSFRSIEEVCNVETALTTADTYNRGALPGMLARAGWFDDLLSWAQKQLDPYGLIIQGEFQQLTCGPAFSLIRLETTGPAIWFKAVGEPNEHECPITIALSKHFPAYVPAIIGIHPSWNAWLAFEAEGSLLNDQSDLVTWKMVAHKLAELQIESATKVPALVDAGCRSLDVSMLLEYIDPFFDVMADLMARQPNAPPAILSPEELRILATQLKEACVSLGAIGLPNTLGHMDFNPGNVVASARHCVFLDWAEAYVGHPFLTFEYLREHLSRNHQGQDAWKVDVTSSYAETWSTFASSAQLSKALELTGLVAVFAYALSNPAWRDSKKLQNPHIAGYLRSLTRRMQRETRSRGNGVHHA
jgi:hypothetical protein